MSSDDWLQRLVEKTEIPAAPRADIADRVIAAIRMERPVRLNRVLDVSLVGMATVAASWMVWLAVPAWEDLNSPVVTVQVQLADLLALRQ